MDLEVIGRHALFFDDDAAAAFVNSTNALVDWNSLLIDRYDVRHLLASPPPPRLKRRPSNPDDSESLESMLDQERYHDLPPDSPLKSDHQDDDAGPANTSGYQAVPFSYGNTGESMHQKSSETEPGFWPPFSVPESLHANLPPTEKLHQIIARTAIFVSKHGGQSEIVLRVKQGDNPTFGFLMPDHSLHAYFRFLVEHQELLNAKAPEEEAKVGGEIDKKANVGRGGALSLLGSVYGTEEDDDTITETASELKRVDVEEGIDGDYANNANGSEGVVSSGNLAEKYEVGSKHTLPLKDKLSHIKRNHSVGKVKVGVTCKIKKEADVLGSNHSDKLQSSALCNTAKPDLPLVEPPSDLKRVIEKIVEFIMRNGREFQGVLAEQDVKHGRFPFLLPSNVYHPYYQKVLEKAEQSKVTGKSSEKEDKKASDTLSLGSDIPFESDKKEKFKMVISKPKKDGQDPPTKAIQPEIRVSVDAAAAEAILQAATRGFNNPNLEIMSKTSLIANSHGPSSESGQVSSFGTHPSSLPQSSIRMPGPSGKQCVSVPVALAIAKTAAIVAASEADSSEASLTREQKLKAERLKRAKMFATMVKAGAAPLKPELLRGLSSEPPGSGIINIVNPAVKEREGSSVPFDVDASDNQARAERMKYSGVDCSERRSKRKYRSRSDKHEDEADDDEGEKKEEEEEDAEELDRKQRKKRHSHRSSHDSKDKHHHHRKKHSSSKDRNSRKQHKRDTLYDEPQHSEEHPGSPRQHKHDESSDDDDEHRHSRRSSKHRSYKHRSYKHDDERKSKGHKRKSDSEKEKELEEGEICSKSDQSKASGDCGSREASVDVSKSSYLDGRAPSQSTDTTEVPDDLRAKIRAMLMATM